MRDVDGRRLLLSSLNTLSHQPASLGIALHGVSVYFAVLKFPSALVRL